MSDIQLPKGTFDILPYGAQEPWFLSSLWQAAEEIIRATAREYGYGEIRTPIYENTELFDRGVGETSDIVSKEMFTFLDRGGRSISLRPEGTAPVMRAVLENRFPQIGPIHKLFYIAPMFRYERPQSGRYRQHHQFGIEALGIPGPEQDAEVIDLLCTVYRRLGLQKVQVRLNCLGDTESRDRFRNALLDFLRPLEAQLSADSQVRLHKNPLRILDSKDPQDRALLHNVPSILDHLTPEADRRFQRVIRLLEQTNVPYLIDSRIIRGLDYYNQTVFEVTAGEGQIALGGGGRYDGFLKNFGGPDLPGVGCGTGLERVLKAAVESGSLHIPERKPFLYILSLCEEANDRCFTLAATLRDQHIPTDLDCHSQKMKQGLQKAVQSNASYVLLLGSEELQKGAFQLKDLTARTQREIPFDQILHELNALHG